MYTYKKGHQIPGGLMEFSVIGKILATSDIDPGECLFLNKMTDKSGWHTTQGLIIIIIDF